MGGFICKCPLGCGGNSAFTDGDRLTPDSASATCLRRSARSGQTAPTTASNQITVAMKETDLIDQEYILPAHRTFTNLLLIDKMLKKSQNATHYRLDRFSTDSKIISLAFSMPSLVPRITITSFPSPRRGTSTVQSVSCLIWLIRWPPVPITR